MKTGTISGVSSCQFRWLRSSQFTRQKQLGWTSNSTDKPPTLANHRYIIEIINTKTPAWVYIYITTIYNKYVQPLPPISCSCFVKQPQDCKEFPFLLPNSPSTTSSRKNCPKTMVYRGISSVWGYKKMVQGNSNLAKNGIKTIARRCQKDIWINKTGVSSFQFLSLWSGHMMGI